MSYLIRITLLLLSFVGCAMLSAMLIHASDQQNGSPWTADRGQEVVNNVP